MTTVTFDALGTGDAQLAVSTKYGTDLNWQHTFGLDADCVLIGINGWQFGYAWYSHTVTIGGIALVLVGQGNLGGGYGDGWCEMWQLQGTDVQAMAGTTQTVYVGEHWTADNRGPYAFQPLLQGNSLSYNGVGSVGPGVVTTGDTVQPVSVIPSDVGHMVVSNAASNGIANASGTVRWAHGGIGGYSNQSSWEAFIIQDAPGTSPSVRMTCGTPAGYWVTVGVDLRPPAVTPGAVIAARAGTPHVLVAAPPLPPPLPANWKANDLFTAADEDNVASTLNKLIANVSGLGGAELAALPSSWVPGSIWSAGDESAVGTAINALNAAVSSLGGPQLLDVPDVGPRWTSQNQNIVEAAINALSAAIATLQNTRG